MNLTNHDLLTVDEAAYLLGVNSNTLRGWIAKKKIPSIKVEGCRLLFKNIVLALGEKE